MSLISLVLAVLLFVLLHLMHILKNLHLFGKCFFNAFDILKVAKLLKISQFTHLRQLVEVDVVAIFVLNDIVFRFFEVGCLLLMLMTHFLWLPFLNFLRLVVLCKYVVPENYLF